MESSMPCSSEWSLFTFQRVGPEAGISLPPPARSSRLSRMRTGSFFSGVMRAYSSLAWPGATVAGTNSILSISPVSIAAMRTLRANGEAREEVSFILKFLERFSPVMPGLVPGIHVLAVGKKDVDGRVKLGHDEDGEIAAPA